jgi:hypothetical protein
MALGLTQPLTEMSIRNLPRAVFLNSRAAAGIISGPRLIEKRIYRAAVLQRLRTTVLGCKGRPARKADNLTAICEPTVWRKCGSLNVSQPYGPSPLLYVQYTVITKLLIHYDSLMTIKKIKTPWPLVRK